MHFLARLQVERTVGGLDKLIFWPISHWPVISSIFHVRGPFVMESATQVTWKINEKLANKK